MPSSHFTDFLTLATFAGQALSQNAEEEIKGYKCTAGEGWAFYEDATPGREYLILLILV